MFSGTNDCHIPILLQPTGFITLVSNVGLYKSILQYLLQCYLEIRYLCLSRRLVQWMKANSVRIKNPVNPSCIEFNRLLLLNMFNTNSINRIVSTNNTQAQYVITTYPRPGNIIFLDRLSSNLPFRESSPPKF